MGMFTEQLLTDVHHNTLVLPRVAPKINQAGKTYNECDLSGILWL